ncbi:hypothetical protein IIC65_07810 [Candidatus Sumerlaeota bacterium]|nr:hypothetical protein [Candidatus Sumerlaeota bacterium]
MVAPMSFMSYPEVRPWAKAIRQAVATREMPPWPASRETAGVFLNERTLTDAEIETMVRWVNLGSRAGSPGDAPAPLEFKGAQGWTIGEPDLIVHMPEAYFIADEVDDVQPHIEITITKEQMPEPRWLQAIEYQPSSEAVHHITGNVTAPAVGDHPEERFWIGSIAPGEDPMIYSEGYGNLLRAGSVIELGLHYHKEAGPGTAVWDRSAVGFKFHPEGVGDLKKVDWQRIWNRDFEIPPGHTGWEVGAGKVFHTDAMLVSLHPHMHYRGIDMTYSAIYPDGTREVLLDVDRWNFDWQTNYLYREPKFIPAGTLLEVTAHFDNSPRRRELIPKIRVDLPVRFGLPTTDEMMNAHVSWINLEPGEAARIGAAAGQIGFRSD